MSTISRIAQELESVRRRTLRLVLDLDDAALRAQYDPLFSPVSWHLGHVAWQEEVFVLRGAGGLPPVARRWDGLFDSFVSEKLERSTSLPEKHDLIRYAERVRAATLELLNRPRTSAEFSDFIALLRFVANHERQHTEIMATVRLLGNLPLRDGAQPEHRVQKPQQNRFLRLAGGRFLLGSRNDPDAWDNEQPAHETKVSSFLLQQFPVNNAEWLEFMEAGGYKTDTGWSARGLAWRREHRVTAPLFWYQRAPGSWWRRTLWGDVPVEPTCPVCHVSFYEAEAYAHFREARLPSESEWELAAAWDPKTQDKRRWPWGNTKQPAADLELRGAAPAPRGSFPEADSALGLSDMVGGVWEWVADAFQPYPGFVPQAYAGYSRPWFDGQHRVARGGSFATAPEIARCAFRNWYTPDLRQPALGVRLAKDVP